MARKAHNRQTNRSRSVRILDAPEPAGYCERTHQHFYVTRADAAFAGAVNLRGGGRGTAVRLSACGDHWHYKHSVKVVRRG